jgi:hypothetical protein
MIKVICIKDCFFGTDFRFEKGKSYDAEISILEEPVVSKYSVYRQAHWIQIFNPKISKWGFNFYLESKIAKWLKFSDFFMTLAECREQQIKSVLDE